MTPMEGKGLLRGGGLLLALALFRVGFARFGHGEGLPPPAEDALPGLTEEARAVEGPSVGQRRELGAGERVDPNRAGAEELDRLPGVGPPVAEAMVHYREGHGGFSKVGDLMEVPGIGPATLARIRSHLDLSRGVPTVLRTKVVPVTRLDLNRAGPQELQALPGIGPALAQRIVQSRAIDGPFRTPEDLLRVKGIGPATLQRIRALIRVGI